MNPDDLEKIVALLKDVKSILFITGAGVSADSGLLTYRGIGGLYNSKNTEDHVPIEMALSGYMLKMKPDLTWKYIAQIEQSCREAKYNRAHAVIAEMEKEFERVWVLTQNVDGFHRDAGTENLIDIHGDLHDLMCISCRYRCHVPNYAELKIPPYCPECGAVLRPDVVLFGEMLPGWKYRKFAEEYARGFDLIFSVGTTSTFPYIAGPVIDAQHTNTITIEINPGQTEVSDIVDYKLSSRAVECLNTIWEKYHN